MRENKFIYTSIFLSFLLIGCSRTDFYQTPNEKKQEFFSQSEEKQKNLIEINNEKEYFQKKIEETNLTTLDKKTSQNILPKRVREKISKQELENYQSYQKDVEDKLIFEKITINLSNVDIKEAFKLITEVSDRNIVLGEEVSGNITIELIDVPWNKALETILKIKGLVKYVDGNIIRIHKPEALRQIERSEIERIKAFKEEMSLKNNTEPLDLEIFKLYYTEPSIVKTQLENLLKEVAKDEINGSKLQIIEDLRTKSLIIETTPTLLEKISKLIQKIDVITQQVLIEAFIVEAGDSFSRNLETGLGVNFIKGNTTGGFGTQIDDTNENPGFGSINLIRNVSSAKLSLELNALEANGLSKTLANPKFFTMDNEKASVMQGYQLAYVTKTNDSTETVFKDAVLKLEATPSVVGDGNILLNILVTKDKPEKLDVSSEPSIAKMEIETKLRIEENSVVVIGGVYEENNTTAEEKIPFLGDIPLIGKMFGGTTDNKTKKELLIFITARTI